MAPSLQGAPIPAAAGIGLRAPHIGSFLSGAIPGGPRAIGWLEVHSENYFAAGGPGVRALAEIRCDYPVSIHGVGLSLGSAEGIDRDHLAALRRLVDWLEPCLVSEHLCWGAAGGTHMNDLLPLPLTRACFDVVARHVMQTQEALCRTILVENISSYLEFRGAEMKEEEFLVELARTTGCRILLDVNNLYVNEVNRGVDARAYIDAIDPKLVAEVHLAGHAMQPWTPAGVLIDTHSTRVCDEVWALYAFALERLGPVPTLIEWDSDIPALDVLCEEAARANRHMEFYRARAA